jgi:hypothetical protein
MPCTINSGAVMAKQAGGNFAMALLLTVSSNVIGIFTSPVLLYLFANVDGVEFPVFVRAPATIAVHSSAPLIRGFRGVDVGREPPLETRLDRLCTAPRRQGPPGAACSRLRNPPSGPCAQHPAGAAPSAFLIAALSDSAPARALVESRSTDITKKSRSVPTGCSSWSRG